MSHRISLLSSIGLTLLVALGIFTARGRLFEMGASAGNRAAQTSTATSGIATTQTADGLPPVIEITLPQPTTVPAKPNLVDDQEGNATRAGSNRVSREDDEGEDEGDDD